MAPRFEQRLLPFAFVHTWLTMSVFLEWFAADIESHISTECISTETRFRQFFA